jgi:hypothetical protein
MAERWERVMTWVSTGDLAEKAERPGPMLLLTIAAALVGYAYGSHHYVAFLGAFVLAALSVGWSEVAREAEEDRRG